MSDNDGKAETDKVKFSVFARIQIRSGRCAMIQCPHFDFSIGPQSNNDECIICYNAAMRRLMT